MNIKKIAIKGYKRFHDLTIDLGDEPKRIVALVGPNGCGKSCVLDSMLYLASQLCGPVGDYKTSYDYRYHSLSGKEDINFNNVKIDFCDGDFMKIRAERTQKGTAKTMFSFRSSFRYNANLKVNQVSSVDDISLNNYGACVTSDLDQKIEQSYRRLQAKYNKYLEEKDCKPSEAKAHIIGELNAAIQNCLNLKIENLGNIEGNNGTINFIKDDYHNPFEFNLLSAGEKEVVDLLLDVYLRKDIYTETIFLFDEPELHLNASIQRKLLVEIDRMIGEKCQIWIATHSVGFLRALQEEIKEKSIIIEFDADKKWASESIELRPALKNRTTWQKLFLTAIDDLSYLICPKIIVYCEGKDKPGDKGRENGLDAQVFNNIFSEKHPDTQFVSSGGNTELDQRSTIGYAILSKIFPEIYIWVLKDRDSASGKITDESTRQDYLRENGTSHRMLKRYEIENYLFDKEVLRKYAQLYECNFNEQEYDSFVENINDQDVKSHISRIKSTLGITVSINPETFKKNLSKCIDSDMNVFAELEREIFDRK